MPSGFCWYKQYNSHCNYLDLFMWYQTFCTFLQVNIPMFVLSFDLFSFITALKEMLRLYKSWEHSQGAATTEFSWWRARKESQNEVWTLYRVHWSTTQVKVLFIDLQICDEEAIPWAVQIVLHGASFQPVLWQSHSSRASINQIFVGHCLHWTTGNQKVYLFQQDKNRCCSSHQVILAAAATRTWVSLLQYPIYFFIFWASQLVTRSLHQLSLISLLITYLLYTFCL